MSIQALATVNDVAVSMMRELNAGELQYAPQLLARVHARILARVPDLVQAAASDENTRYLIVEIEAEAVARVLRADGAIYTSETEGDYSYSLNSAVAGASLQVTDQEWERLTGALGSIQFETDGYLATRRGGLPPDLHFQYAWPGLAYPSTVL